MSTFRFIRERNTAVACGLFCGLIVLLQAGFVLAEPDVTVNGQVRARHEFDGKSFHPDYVTQNFIDLRTRLGVGAKLNDNTDVFVQLQDSRRLGGMDLEGKDQSGTLDNGQQVDVHQAYLKINQLWQDGLGLQLGRFEVNLGNQRIFGAVGWNNVGRSWEGVSPFFDRDGFEARGFWLKRRELNDPMANRDFDIFGLNAKLKNLGAELFVFLENDADQMADSVDTEVDKLGRVNVGTYVGRKYGDLDIALNAVYQTGKQRATTAKVFVEQDIAAFLFTFEAGYTLNPDSKARLAAGIDYSSGDDPDTEDHEAYDNLYYTAHKFRGFMDYFLASHPMGLIDMILRGQVAPAAGWLLKADLHLFQAAQEYDVGGNATSKDVGTEIDLTVSTSRIEGAGLTGGLSVFLPKENWAGENTDTALWFYTMFTVGF
ncbi:MAG: alginate export family protein [bacterium]